MPEGDTTQDPATQSDTINEVGEVKWFGEEKIFTIGTRDVKIWELLVGLIILSMILPLLVRGGARSGGTTKKDGATIINVRQTGQRKVYQRKRKKKK